MNEKKIPLEFCYVRTLYIFSFYMPDCAEHVTQVTFSCTIFCSCTELQKYDERMKWKGIVQATIHYFSP